MTRFKTDYSKTIIYKLVKNDDLENENIYIGSTTDFTSRKYSHKGCCNNENSKQHNLKVYKIIRSNGGWGEWSMIEIEKFPCNDKNEALSRERYWYEFYNAKLNSYTMIITPEEKKEKHKKYCIDNADKIKEQRKQYRIDNPDIKKQYDIDNADKIKQYYKQYNIENADKQKQYYIENADIKKDYSKQYYIENADKIKQKMTCECGSVIRRDWIVIHAKSKRHINYVNSLDN